MPMRIASFLGRLAFVSVAVSGTAAAQNADSVRAHYSKTEYQVPMRDGTRLFTVVYVPRDTTRQYPIMLARTPYGVGPYGADAYPRVLGPSPRFAEDGFIFVYQDVRGRFMSEGDFVHMTPWRGMAGAGSTDESTDAYDTIDWLIRHIAHNNGRVGVWGISYPGYFAAASLVNAHPALKAVSPQAPQGDWFMGDDVHHHGAFLLASAFNFFATSGRARPSPTTRHPGRFDFGTTDGYAFFLRMGPLSNADRLYLKGTAPFWNDMMAHGTYDDFWKARSLGPQLHDVRPAVLAVGGWYDANDLYGTLLVHESIKRQSPGTSSRIVIGPWSHGEWRNAPGNMVGDLQFGSNTGQFFRDSIEYPFFAHYLKGGRSVAVSAAGSVAVSHATMFETGTNRWRTFDSWPPKNGVTKRLFVRAGGRLSFEPPSGMEGRGYDEYRSDPAKPVPFLEKPNTDMKPDYMALDQRFGAVRPDVLVYTSDPLTEDVTIAGPVRPTLFVSTSGTDSDWIVKLIDVHPDDTPGRPIRQLASSVPGGFEQLVRGDVMRGKFRNSYVHPEPFVPGAVAKVAFEMNDVLHTFQKGHRIMVQVQSTWFPLVDVNPQTFVDIYNARPSDFRSATERVYRSGSQPSNLEFELIP